MLKSPFKRLWMNQNVKQSLAEFYFVRVCVPKGVNFRQWIFPRGEIKIYSSTPGYRRDLLLKISSTWC